MLRPFALGIPPDDTMRTAEEIAAGTNHSSEYYGEDLPREPDVHDWLDERRRIEAINSKPLTRHEYEQAVARVAELERALLRVAARIAAHEKRLSCGPA